MSRTNLIPLLFILIVGCYAPQKLYSPIDMVSKHKSELREKTMAPHIREGKHWYYFDGSYPGGYIAKLTFSEDGYVSAYTEFEYDEWDYPIWIPKLILSLKDSDPEVRYRAYRFLKSLVEDFTYRSSVARLEEWAKIPFKSQSYQDWKEWWDIEKEAWRNEDGGVNVP